MKTHYQVYEALCSGNKAEISKCIEERRFAKNNELLLFEQGDYALCSNYVKKYGMQNSVQVELVNMRQTDFFKKIKTRFCPNAITALIETENIELMWHYASNYPFSQKQQCHIIDKGNLLLLKAYLKYRPLTFSSFLHIIDLKKADMLALIAEVQWIPQKVYTAIWEKAPEMLLSIPAIPFSAEQEKTMLAFGNLALFKHHIAEYPLSEEGEIELINLNNADLFTAYIEAYDLSHNAENELLLNGSVELTTMYEDKKARMPRTTRIACVFSVHDRKGGELIPEYRPVTFRAVENSLNPLEAELTTAEIMEIECGLVPEEDLHDWE